MAVDRTQSKYRLEKKITVRSITEFKDYSATISSLHSFITGQSSIE